MLVFIFSGVSRHIGFVGFKTEEEAKNAVTFFNNTYLDTSKLQVELAEAVTICYSKIMA
jgi:multiple RNA-binding domain-containing protein 1